MNPPLSSPQPPSAPPHLAPHEPLVARGPEDLVALVPVVLGFEPAHSLVLLTFGGEHPFHARIDLPDVEHLTAAARGEEVAVVVEQLVEPACRHRVRSAVGVVYTDDARLAREVEQRLRARCRDLALPLLVALRVAAGRWYPLRGGSSRERREGVAFDVADHPFRAEAVGRGLVTRGSRADLAATLAPDPDGAAAVERLVAGLGPPTDLGAAARRREGARVADTVRALVAQRRAPTDAEVALLVVSCRDVGLREVAWRQMSRPSAHEHVELWTQVLRRAPAHPASLRVAPAGLLAFASWLAGNGALAWCALDRLAEADPDDRIGGLVAALLQEAVPPQRWEEVSPSGPGAARY